ncbi:hypothetical protein MGA5115_01790 [Marinomonas gallaica]|mgnify:CR=1 FL=1|uniref:Uncharacterized protein n=1 Tax=Marinomonas gallaica TaxID=1806667 RepID=A0A1C3JR44_9GAMM|nr:hypothetical protein [Marinomonas gallaica]SBT17674.1 hypothetical protein MGA5115_01790 [Marinomonas gallaica]SBT20000.1 hypothetical protein MGA5116_00583 [Marinomonas gallaica]
MEFNIKLIFSGIAIALALIGFVPYIALILRGKVKPHVFSWVIWGITTTVIFFAQLEAEGGVGAWPIGLSGFVTILIAILAYLKRGDATITRADWGFLLAAIASLPLWYVTDDPLWTVVILTTIDMIGFGPTFRKAYHRPFEDSRVFFIIMILRNACSVVALEAYSVTTVLFPFCLAVGFLILLIILQYRRVVLAQQAV